MSLTDVVSAMGFGMSTVIDDVLAPGENRPESARAYVLIALTSTIECSVIPQTGIDQRRLG